MGQIRFGTSQLNNPTPSSRSKPLDIFCAVAGVVIAWLTTAPYIPSAISDIISGILGLLIGIAQAIKPFWGIEVPPVVNSSDVNEIDNSKK